jgi:hypothetical protein
MFNDPRIGTAAAGGVALAIVYLAVHTFTYFSGVEVSADYQSALLTVVVAIGATFVHRVSEDQAALHKLILARLGEQTPPVQPPGGTVPPIQPVQQWPRRPQPSPMGDVRP